jgi:two-component system, NtrC family, response regulator HydG
VFCIFAIVNSYSLMIKILLVEDDITFSQLLFGFLQKNGYTIDAVANVKSALKLLKQQTYNLLLLDYRLPDGTGLDIFSNSRQNGLKIPAIIMTSFNDVRTAVKAIQAGAFDYITKPVNPDELIMVIKNALNTDQKQTINDKTPIADFIKGKSADADKLYAYIDVVAPTDIAVMIQGETGTGKEYAARIIHQQSKRSNKPFISVDCGALSKDLAASELFGHVKGAFTGAVVDKKGLFEVADGGTLFLDEVGNLSYEVQIKLLRTLQEKAIQPLGDTRLVKVDVRIITATNDDLLNSVNQGDFRQDLYHRINEFKLQLPALRDRANDLDLFINHFIKQSNAELERNVQSISPEVRKVLTQYDWPGNLRELRNVIKRMVLLTLSTVANVESLPDEMLFTVTYTSKPQSDLKLINETNEKELIQKTLEKVKFNKSKAAKLLNIDRKTLYSKIERYGIDV